jgi:DNA repair protein RadC
MMNLKVRSATGRYRRACKSEVLEVAAQYLAASLQRRVSQPLTSPDAVEGFLVQALAPRDAEVFCALFLDNRHRLIQFDEMFRGTIDGSSVHAREVVRRTLELNAAALVLAHNHPSGVAEPSQADEAITRRLTEALALIDVRVLDHMVVAGNTVTSFVQRGLI